MRRSPEQLALIERFGRSYVRGQMDTMRAIERNICGCDYGGTSWTTRDEAEDVSKLLALCRGKSLLDIGAGSGWPALYLAETSGCDVTLVDLPAEGIRIAMDRAAADRIDGNCRAAVADGSALPFSSGLFDAISHSDVLCCLEAKITVLSECRRVVRDCGKMVFSVISIAAGASPKQAAAAVALGPPYIEAECGYGEMLEKTDWRVTDCMDLSPEFEHSTRRLVDEWRKNEARVKPLVGNEDFDNYLTRKVNTLPLIHDGTIRRLLFSAAPALG